LTKIQAYLAASTLTFLLWGSAASAQTIRDSSGTKLEISATLADARLDSINNIVSPRKAAIRSAIIPGWGQVYVRKGMKGSIIKKYWKLPVIYGALGTSAGVFIYNLQWYRRTRFAYTTFATKDSNNYGKVHPSLRRLENDLSFLQLNRNEFRRDVDYSVLFFVLLWGLNVVDATVDAHLKSFDVSPDLSLRLTPGHSELAGTNGVSLVLTFK
jgi:hypothetical protein